ncbi:hypothetical protein FOMPIDRAFT_94527 [Fomitopsis schrenkii]|uniref:Uncharacterized protein n=1 Tax=Fomitopsis schrenkii TaxID=2126942 RepID=S8FR34_FOMSC|nr:hypothetical protein FOMPIDRAFT_94527 [Fomitopsis schrenkii]
MAGAKSSDEWRVAGEQGAEEGVRREDLCTYHGDTDPRLSTRTSGTGLIGEAAHSDTGSASRGRRAAADAKTVSEGACELAPANGTRATANPSVDEGGDGRTEVVQKQAKGGLETSMTQRRTASCDTSKRHEPEEVPSERNQRSESQVYIPGISEKEAVLFTPGTSSGVGHDTRDQSDKRAEGLADLNVPEPQAIHCTDHARLNVLECLFIGASEIPARETGDRSRVERALCSEKWEDRNEEGDGRDADSGESSGLVSFMHQWIALGQNDSSDEHSEGGRSASAAIEVIKASRADRGTEHDKADDAVGVLHERDEDARHTKTDVRCKAERRQDGGDRGPTRRAEADQQRAIYEAPRESRPRCSSGEREWPSMRGGKEPEMREGKALQRDKGAPPEVESLAVRVTGLNGALPPLHEDTPDTYGGEETHERAHREQRGTSDTQEDERGSEYDSSHGILSGTTSRRTDSAIPTTRKAAGSQSTRGETHLHVNFLEVIGTRKKTGQRVRPAKQKEPAMLYAGFLEVVGPKARASRFHVFDEEEKPCILQADSASLRTSEVTLADEIVRIQEAGYAGCADGSFKPTESGENCDTAPRCGPSRKASSEPEPVDEACWLLGDFGELGIPEPQAEEDLVGCFHLAEEGRRVWGYIPRAQANVALRTVSQTWDNFNSGVDMETYERRRRAEEAEQAEFLAVLFATERARIERLAESRRDRTAQVSVF